MKTVPLWVAAALLVFGGCADRDAVEVGSAADAIKSGEAVLGGSEFAGTCMMDVVLPDDDDGNPQDPIVCTCTLVVANMILTSARCVNENVDAGTLNDITVRFAVGGSNPPGGIAVAAVELHRYFDEDDPALFQLALVTLVADAPVGETPVTLHDADIESLEDQMVRLVGYGETDDNMGNFGQRRGIDAPLVSVFRDFVIAGDEDKTSCDGDSGGPVFFDFGSGFEQIAVTQRQGSCTELVPRTRIDAFTDTFLFPYIDQKTGPCRTDGSCVTVDCRTPDPDCPENACNWGNTCVEDCPTRDWDCAIGKFAGETCAQDGDCEEEGRCIAALDDPTFLYCSRPCRAGEDGDCPGGMTCTGDGEGGDECAFGNPSPGSQGFSCNNDDTCRSGICEDLICVFECTPGAGDCAAPFVCGPSKVVDGTNVCLGEDLSGGGGFCQAGGGSGQTGALALLLAAVLIGLRRRRHS